MTPKKEEILTLIGLAGILLFMLTIKGMDFWQTKQFNRRVQALTPLSLTSVQEVRIRPRTNQFGGGIPFAPADPLVAEFLKAVSDIRAYHGSPKGTLSRDHEWSIEIEMTDEHIIQMRCDLPANREEVAHGYFKEYHYGPFQSRGLYRWYQKYSHRWLGKKKNDKDMSMERSP
ncbi:MAG: hypothetical protein GY801_16430 [bacterium]|nr:hypothetical protein [bacterium]